MEEKVLSELKQIRKLMSELIGTSELPAKEKFSKEAVAKAAKEYRKMATERGEWLSRDDIGKVIKGGYWHDAKVIIEKFGFTNYYKKGHSYYFNKKDLVALSKELKKRNINFREYCSLLEDQKDFQSRLDKIRLGKGPKKRFKIPEELRDINTKPYSPPSEELVRGEINKLMEEFNKFDLSEYIALYEKKTYSMFKYTYHFDRYVEPKLKRYCEDWCFKFNYANEALKELLKLKSKKGIID